MYVGIDWDEMDTGEVDNFTLDFVNDLLSTETILTAVFTCEVLSGTDATPSARLSGSAIITGTKVSQVISGTLDAVSYRLIATVTTNSSRTLKLWSHFPSAAPD